MKFRKFLSVVGVLCMLLPVWSGTHKAWALVADTTGFVKVGLVITAPGESFFSAYGHAALRMQCPSHGLDYCFSPEVAQPGAETTGFFTSTNRMGLIAARTQDYLQSCQKEQRKVMEYPLNLTSDEKKDLWRLLDGKLAEGLYMPYDYLNRGCAQEIASFVEVAIGRESVAYDVLPEWLAGSRREIIYRALGPFPWKQLFIMLMLGNEPEGSMPVGRKLMMPADMAVVWRDAEIVDTAGNRRPLVADAPVVLYDAPEKGATSLTLPFLPLSVFVAVLLWVVALTWLQVCRPDAWCRWCGRVTDSMLFLAQALMGLFLTYLWLCTPFVGTGWNKYHILLNPLPLVVYVWSLVRPFPCRVWRKVYMIYGLVLAGFILACVWLPCPDYPLWCLFGAMAVRCFYHAYIYKEERIKNNKSNSKRKRV